MTQDQKKQLIQDILHSYMKGDSNHFHEMMEKAQKEFAHEERQYVQSLIKTFPKHYNGCIDAIYQLLSSIIELKMTAMEVNESNLEEMTCIGGVIHSLEIKEHAPWSK